VGFGRSLFNSQNRSSSHIRKGYDLACIHVFHYAQIAQRKIIRIEYLFLSAILGIRKGYDLVYGSHQLPRVKLSLFLSLLLFS
jgi:hypothetical protein